MFRGGSPASGIASFTGGNSWFVPSGGASFTAVTAPADTTEDTLATITIPALSANAIIRVTTQWTLTNSANAKTLRIRLSGASGTQFYAFSALNVVTLSDIRWIANRNSTSSQVGMGSTSFGNNVANGTSGAAVTSAVDTSVPTTLVITAQKGTGSETVTLEGYLVEIYKP